MQRFGEKLHTLRTRHGMTTRALAQSLGYISHSYIVLVEQGKKFPKVEFVVKVADLFGVPMETLVRDELDLEQ